MERDMERVMPKTVDQAERFEEVWDSLAPEVKEDLERLYFRLRVIKNEAQLNGVRNNMIEKLMPEKFWSLWKQIGKGGMA